MYTERVGFIFSVFRYPEFVRRQGNEIYITG